jgi:hypothetical protein
MGTIKGTIRTVRRRNFFERLAFLIVWEISLAVGGSDDSGKLLFEDSTSIMATPLTG